MPSPACFPTPQTRNSQKTTHHRSKASTRQPKIYRGWILCLPFKKITSSLTPGLEIQKVLEEVEADHPDLAWTQFQNEEQGHMGIKFHEDLIAPTKSYIEISTHFSEPEPNLKLMSKNKAKKSPEYVNQRKQGKIDFLLGGNKLQEDLFPV